MARIYNYMGFDIAVVGGPSWPIEIPAYNATIGNNDRSESLEWTMAFYLSVYDTRKGPLQDPVGYFNFGTHAQIQGGNYAILSPNSFVVYDSNHEVIARGEINQ